MEIPIRCPQARVTPPPPSTETKKLRTSPFPHSRTCIIRKDHRRSLRRISLAAEKSIGVSVPSATRLAVSERTSSCHEGESIDSSDSVRPDQRSSIILSLSSLGSARISSTVTMQQATAIFSEPQPSAFTRPVTGQRIVALSCFPWSHSFTSIKSDRTNRPSWIVRIAEVPSPIPSSCKHSRPHHPGHTHHPPSAASPSVPVESAHCSTPHPAETTA